MAKKGTLVWSLKHRPPLSLSIIGSILLFLMSSKEAIIDTMPISNAEHLAIAGAWYMYVLKGAGTIIGALNIFLGVDKNPKPDTDHPLN